MSRKTESLADALLNLAEQMRSMQQQRLKLFGQLEISGPELVTKYTVRRHWVKRHMRRGYTARRVKRR